MEDNDWAIETRRRHGLTAKYFEASENVTILNFITTAKDVSKEEIQAIAEKTK